MVKYKLLRIKGDFVMDFWKNFLKFDEDSEEEEEEWEEDEEEAG